MIDVDKLYPMYESSTIDGTHILDFFEPSDDPRQDIADFIDGLGEDT